jgi:hypothetical protein
LLPGTVRSANGYHLVRRRGHQPGSGMALFEGWLRRQLASTGGAVEPRTG